jgi:hypothetical protein
MVFLTEFLFNPTAEAISSSVAPLAAMSNVFARCTRLASSVLDLLRLSSFPRWVSSSTICRVRVLLFLMPYLLPL